MANCKYLPVLLAIFFVTQTFAHHNVHHTDGDDKESSTSRIRAPGSPSEIPVNDLKVVEYVAKAEKQYSAQYPGDNHPKVKEIIKATKQVVAGSKYKINLKFGTSDCPKSGEFTDRCALLEDSPVKECNVEAWIKPWENFEQITVTCNE